MQCATKEIAVMSNTPRGERKGELNGGEELEGEVVSCLLSLVGLPSEN